MSELYETESQQQDDLNFDGLKSYPDPRLVTDSRILGNILGLDRLLSKRKRSHNENCQNSTNSSKRLKKAENSEIKPHMRKIVVDWMLQVCEEQQCQTEVFPLAVNYMDRFMTEVAIKKNQFQLVACVCIFLASKFKESAPLCAEKLVVYTDFSISTEDIVKWELLVLEVLNWDLSVVTPHCVLAQLLQRLELRSSGFNVSTVKRHAETFVSLAALEDKEFFSSDLSALAGASALVSALHGLKQPHQDSALIREILDSVSAMTSLSSADVLAGVIKIEAAISQRLPQPQQTEDQNAAFLDNAKSYEHESQAVHESKSNLVVHDSNNNGGQTTQSRKLQPNSVSSSAASTPTEVFAVEMQELEAIA